MKKVVAVVSGALLSFSLFACSSAHVDTRRDVGGSTSESSTENNANNTFVPKSAVSESIKTAELSPVGLTIGGKEVTFGKTTVTDMINTVQFNKPFFREILFSLDGSGDLGDSGIDFAEDEELSNVLPPVSDVGSDESKAYDFNGDGGVDSADFYFEDAVGVDGKESNLLQQLKKSTVELGPDGRVSLYFRLRYVPALDRWTDNHELEEEKNSDVIYDSADCYWEFEFEKSPDSSRLEDAVLLYAHVEGDFAYYDMNEDDEYGLGYLNAKEIIPEVRFADKNLVLGDVSDGDIDYIFSKMGAARTVIDADEFGAELNYSVSSEFGDNVYGIGVDYEESKPAVLVSCDKAHEKEFLM